MRDAYWHNTSCGWNHEPDLLAAPLIRLAATDTEYAQDLRDAVQDDQAFGGLVYAEIQADDLTELTATQWLWYASWRQELGGGCFIVLIELVDTQEGGSEWLGERHSPAGVFDEPAGHGATSPADP